MTTSKDFVRQASLFTMGGLTDPRLMPGYKSPLNATETKSAWGFNFLTALRKSVDGLTGKKINNEPAQG